MIFCFTASAEPVSQHPGTRERLGRKVERGVRVPRPAQLEPIDAVGVTVVQLTKRVRIRPRGAQQRGVRSLHVRIMLGKRNLLLGASPRR
jgi:hypothetical protein